MRFVADENVDVRIVERLVADGHELTVLLSAISGKKDPEVLVMADRSASILITEDKDFGELVFRLKAAHAGVILIRLHGLRGDEQADLVSKAIQEREGLLNAAFTVIGPRRMRVRRT